MKLILCKKCGDVVSLRMDRRACFCGESWGTYVDGIHAVIGGRAIPLGFANSSFFEALRARPDDGDGSLFTAFVIPKKCPTVKEEKKK